MPELPEVETTKTSLSPLLNYKVTNVEVFQRKLRWPVPTDIQDLEGYYLIDIERRAKYLILSFISSKYTTLSASRLMSAAPAPLSLIIHLGMSGSLQQYPLHTEKRKHDHLIFTFKNEDIKGNINDKDSKDASVIQLHYHDPRRFGAVLWHHDYAHKLFDHLGVEPLSKEFTGEYLYNRIHKINPNSGADSLKSKPSKPFTRPIKSIIMDQAFVVGVGNIYATESLFLTGIHPETPAHTLPKEQIDTLTQHIKTILKTAIEQGGSTLRDFTVASGTTGYFQQKLHVYGKYKEPCPTCETSIDKALINGRTSTFCPACQKRP